MSSIFLSTDSRAVGLPFTSLPGIVSVTLCYVAMLKIGPKLMENRKAFTLRGPILFYNFVQIVLNSTLLIRVNLPLCRRYVRILN